MTVQAGVDAHSDGTGFVRAAVGLDAEAAKAVDLASELRVEDLKQAGWTVSGPEKDGDGTTWVRASKPFSNPAQADEIMTELTGDAGPLRNFKLQQSRSLLRSKTSFSGVVDLSGALAGFMDPDLISKLGDASRIDPGAFKFEVTAKIPGASRTWEARVGQQTPLQLSASSPRLVPAVPAALAVVCVAAAGVVVLARRRRRVRPWPRSR